MPLPTARMARPRNNDLAEIHIAAGKLGMDTSDKNPESEYRQMLWTHGRVRSAGDLDHAGRARVVAHLRQLMQARGLAKPGQTYPGRPARPPASKAEQIKKVEALLADSGRGWDYANSMCKRMFKIDAIEFATSADLQKLIAALVYDQKRQAKRIAQEVFPNLKGQA